MNNVKSITELLTINGVNGGIAWAIGSMSPLQAVVTVIIGIYTIIKIVKLLK